MLTLAEDGGGARRGKRQTENQHPNRDQYRNRTCSANMFRTRTEDVSIRYRSFDSAVTRLRFGAGPDVLSEEEEGATAEAIAWGDLRDSPGPLLRPDSSGPIRNRMVFLRLVKTSNRVPPTNRDSVWVRARF